MKKSSGTIFNAAKPRPRRGEAQDEPSKKSSGTIVRETLAIIAAGLLLSAGLRATADDLYSPATFNAPASDHRAQRPGDNLTVLVTEMTTATSDARTSTDKNGSLSGSMDFHSRQQKAAFSVGDTFDGGGTTEASDKLVASLTVVVRSVDPNGYLRVAGRQVVNINGERQTLSVAGRVRPQDIAPNNTVLSSQLSDARISYTGKGMLGESQRPGIFTRFLSWLRIL